MIRRRDTEDADYRKGTQVMTLELGEWGRHVLELMEFELLRIEEELGRGELRPSRALAIRFRHERMGELLGGMTAALAAA